MQISPGNYCYVNNRQQQQQRQKAGKLFKRKNCFSCFPAALEVTHRSRQRGDKAQRGDTLQSPLCRVVLRPRGRSQLSVIQSDSQLVSQLGT